MEEKELEEVKEDLSAFIEEMAPKKEGVKYITNPAIIRLARKAGIKNFSAGCYPVVGELIEEELKRIIHVIKIVNDERETKTIMKGDVYQAFNLLNEKITHSEHLNGQTTKKV